MFCTPNIEPLLCVEEDALGHSLKVAAKLAQHIATPLVHYSQVNKPTSSIPGERMEGGREREGGKQREMKRGRVLVPS